MIFQAQMTPLKLFLLDLGNSRLNGGIFFAQQFHSKFSMPSKSGASVNDYMEWFQKILAAEASKEEITGVVISSVVPEETPILLEACRQFFTQAKAVLELNPTETSIELCCDHPSEVGADRVANMLGARHFFPQENFPYQDILIFDCGTATTAEILTAKNEFIGGLIAPGLKTSLEGLKLKASKLSGLEVPLIRPLKVLGTSTVDNIQAGIYFSALGLMKEMIHQLKKSKPEKPEKPEKRVIVIGTGGFSGLFKEEGVFDLHEPDLILWGLVEFWVEKFS
jgi:type III pantothenate kinase